MLLAGDNRCLPRSAARVQTLYHLRRRLCPVAVLARCEIDATLSCWRQPLLAMQRRTRAVTISGLAPVLPRRRARWLRAAAMLLCWRQPLLPARCCTCAVTIFAVGYAPSPCARSMRAAPRIHAGANRCCGGQVLCSATASNLDAVAAMMLRASTLLQNDETLYFCNCFQPRCCCNADERAPTQSACLRRRRSTLDVLTRCVGSRCKLRYASIRPLTTVVCGAMLHLSLSSPSAVLHRRACSM